MTKPADLVIIGGGLAGLSLAQRLAQRATGGRVIIIEPRTVYKDDRSWAFWTPADGKWAKAASRIWTHWRFGARSGAMVTASDPRWNYAYLRSSTVYDRACAEISSTPLITLALGVRAFGLQRSSNGVEVETSAGKVCAHHVIDTRPPNELRIAGSLLLQSFYGREIMLADAANDTVVDVMCDMRSDANGFVFAYVLPLTPKRILVEITRFSTASYGSAALAPDLNALLTARGWADAPVLREEFAVLPMGLPAEASHCNLVGLVHAGTSAGALRAATGFGFLRIQNWADRCADKIANGQPPITHMPEPRLRAWMDAVFLRALAANPARAPEFFLRLADRVPPASLARFLSDDARWGDILHVMAALPPAPFLSAIPPQRVTRRRVT